MRIGVTVPVQARLEATLAGFEVAEGLGVDSVWFSQPPGGFDALTVLAPRLPPGACIKRETGMTDPHSPASPGA